MKTLTTSSFNQLNSKHPNIKIDKAKASTQIKKLIAEAIESAGSDQQVEQIKQATRLAIEAVQINMNNGGGQKILSSSITQKLSIFNNKTYAFFLFLITQELTNLEITSTHSFYTLGNIKPSLFGGINYTKTNQSLLYFIDKLSCPKPKFDFFSAHHVALPAELVLHVSSFLEEKDRRAFEQVNARTYYTRGSAPPNWLVNLKLNPEVLKNVNSANNFIEYLKSDYCVIRNLDLSGTKLTINFADRLLEALKDNNSINTLNLAGCGLDIDDHRLNRLGQLPNIIKIILIQDEIKNSYRLLNQLKDKLFNTARTAKRGEDIISFTVLFAKIIVGSDLGIEQNLEILGYKYNPSKPRSPWYAELAWCTSWNMVQEMELAFFQVVIKSDLKDEHKNLLLPDGFLVDIKKRIFQIQTPTYSRSREVWTSIVLTSHFTDKKKVALLLIPKDSLDITGDNDSDVLGQAYNRTQYSSPIEIAFKVGDSESAQRISYLIQESDLKDEYKITLLA
jgi:hypothetical protein